MNDEKYKDTLQACFYGDKGAYNKCMYEFQHRGLKIEQLESNWRYLKEWINEFLKSNDKWFKNELSNHDKMYYNEIYTNTEAMLKKFLDKMNELEKGEVQ